ncbi:MAG TPA: hydrogenase maturation nickel metallochaperone HypA [Pyrinomonadaceae bacterium]|nr:hydrogenase maturation nickel metallochaperone HypA [Pyrinomonadaceae bacterium]
MHELSIAMSMVEMATEECQRLGAERVTALHLKVGLLSGVVKEALIFSYEVVCAGTPLQGSKLVIEDVPVKVYCPRCNSKKDLDSIQLFACPACGELTPEVLEGRELQVVAMEIEERQEVAEAVMA